MLLPPCIISLYRHLEVICLPFSIAFVYAVKSMFCSIIQTYLWWFKVHILIKFEHQILFKYSTILQGYQIGKDNSHLRFILYNGYLINYTKNALFTTKTLDLFTYCSQRLLLANKKKIVYFQMNLIVIIYQILCPK